MWDLGRESVLKHVATVKLTYHDTSAPKLSYKHTVNLKKDCFRNVFKNQSSHTLFFCGINIILHAIVHLHSQINVFEIRNQHVGLFEKIHKSFLICFSRLESHAHA